MNSINDLVIKQRDCDKKLHRWKTWNPNTPFAPTIDASIYLDSIEHSVANLLIDFIIENNLGSYENDAWKKYNIFSFDNPLLLDLRNSIWKSYNDYCKSLGVEIYPRDFIFIRGWGLKLSQNENVKIHSHSLHENTFVSGNISLSDNNTTTDYWIPLFSLYHGMFECKNIPGTMALFPSWLQHGVNPNTSGKDRYSFAFDLFTKKSIDYVLETNTQDTDSGKPIVLSVPL